MVQAPTSDLASSPLRPNRDAVRPPSTPRQPRQMPSGGTKGVCDLRGRLSDLFHPLYRATLDHLALKEAEPASSRPTHFPFHRPVNTGTNQERHRFRVGHGVRLEGRPAWQEGPSRASGLRTKGVT